MHSKNFLLKALELANIRRGFCSPNPAVGAVIVGETGDILATGYHMGAGQAHAEVDALKKLHGKAKDATIYITLEPCCHHGRTPPCTDAIIQSGIKHVVYGFADPNPIVSGKSSALLAENHITSELILLPEIAEFYESYRYWHQTKKPVVTAKIAMSLDGKIAAENNHPIAITGPELQKLTHECRKNSDAILTTAKTILHDDPQLNVRGLETIAKPVYILDRELKISLDARIFSTAQSVTLFHDKYITADALQKFSEKNIRCIGVDLESGKLNLAAVIELIGHDGVHDLWVEAGGVLFSELARQHLSQKMLIYVAPRWLGRGLSAFPEHFSLEVSGSAVSWKQVGSDVVCEIKKVVP